MLTVWDPNSEKINDKETERRIDVAYHHAKDFWEKERCIEALKSMEKPISVHGNQERVFSLHELQGDIFFKLAKETDITDIKCVYLLASLDAFSTSTLLCPTAVRSFRGYARSAILLGDQLRVNKIYEKALLKAKRGLAVTQPRGQYESDSFDRLKKELQTLMNLAERKMNAVVTCSSTSTKANQMVVIKKEHSKAYSSFDRLKNFWVELDDKTKRELMIIDVEKLTEYIQRKYGTEVKEHFQKCLPAKNNFRWRCWKCHICSQVSYCFTDCKMHILDNHVLKFEPKSSVGPKCVDMVLADMICCGNWEPVDTAAAANLIKDRIEREEEFVYINGWCNDWPVAKDKEREDILKQFAEVLKSSCPNENNTLSCTVWNWLIGYTEENLELPQIAGRYLDKWSFFENPQCICFLGLKHLKHILEYFTQLLADDVHVSLVLKVVNEFLGKSMVKERINLEGVSTYNLLLDEKLLYDGEHDFDETGIVRILKSSGTYENVIPKGDKFVSWVLDCQEIDQTFVSQMAEGVHNFEIWFAALRIVRGVVRKMVSYIDEKLKMVTYEQMLGEIETICDREDKRKNANQKSTYALTLGVKYEEKALKQVDDTKWFLNVVIDVLEKAKSPTFVILDDKRDMKDIRRLFTTVSNDSVKRSLSTLRKSLKEKFHLIDSRILVNEFFCKELHGFTKLSTIDYRLVVIPLVKKFLQDKLRTMMNTHVRLTSVAADEPESKKRSLDMMQGN